MIDADVFTDAWGRLEERFGHHDGSTAYLAWLDRQGFETDEFVDAAEYLWAHSKYFPNPADFTHPRALYGWRALLAAARKGRPADGEAWQAMRQGIPDRAWAAINDLGGLDVVRETKDLPRLRERFLEVWDEVELTDEGRRLTGAR